MDRIQHVLDDGVGEKFDLLVLLRAVEHDLRGPKLIAAMNQRHLGGEAGKEVRFLHGRIAAADDRDFFSGKEEAIAGGTGRNPVPDQRFFARQSQPACRGPAGDDQGAGVNRLLAKIHREGPLAQIHAGHMAQLILRPKTSRLLAHVLNQFGSLNAFGKPGKIFHQRGERELASRLMAFNHQGLEIGAGGVERSRMAGAAGPNDDDVANVLHI